MSHVVKFVTDDQMPEGTDFILATSGSDVFAFLRRSALSERLLEEAWEASLTWSAALDVEGLERVRLRAS